MKETKKHSQWTLLFYFTHAREVAPVELLINRNLIMSERFCDYFCMKIAQWVGLANWETTLRKIEIVKYFFMKLNHHYFKKIQISLYFMYILKVTLSKNFVSFNFISKLLFLHQEYLSWFFHVLHKIYFFMRAPKSKLEELPLHE